MPKNAREESLVVSVINKDNMKGQFYWRTSEFSIQAENHPPNEKKMRDVQILDSAKYCMCKKILDNMHLFFPIRKRTWTALKNKFWKWYWNWHQVKHWARNDWNIKPWGWQFCPQSNKTFRYTENTLMPVIKTLTVKDFYLCTFLVRTGSLTSRSKHSKEALKF